MNSRSKNPYNGFFSVVDRAEDDDSDETEEVREVTKLLSGGIMETQFGDLNVFANRDTPTPPVDETGTVHLSLSIYNSFDVFRSRKTTLSN